MESLDPHSALALLSWQVELGAAEAIGDEPVNRYDVESAPSPVPAQPDILRKTKTADSQAGDLSEEDPVVVALRAASAAQSLDELRSALAAFEQCELKRGARNLVFSDGVAGSPVMLVGEAPGRDEDIEGRPFVGRAGQLLDRMLAAIGMSRSDVADPVYITNVLPWRPPQNRDPTPQEIAMMRPFVLRHIELARPKVVVIMGNISAQCLLGKRGITRLRGTWTEAQGLPAIPTFHPAYLLRNPAAKRESWADLLSLRSRVSDD
ncbi:MAG: uracil-DNA glycosylase [Pseudomonadota bacterium]